MPKVYSAFLDANVWFSAACSKTGASFLIMQLAQLNFIKIFTNQHVLNEAERNLLLKSPVNIAAYYHLLSEVNPIIIDKPIASNLKRALAKLVPLPDVPILAGAIVTGAQYLISLDRRHIVNEKLASLHWPFKIVLPGGFLGVIRDDFQKSE